MKQAGARLLHIDDDSDFLRLFSVSFRKNFNVTSACNYSEALDYLEQEAFDAIVLDYDMPEINGLELLSIIKDNKPEIPVVFFTGQGNEEIAREAFVAGASDYFTKDFTDFSTKEKFVNSIKRLVEKRNTEIQLQKSEKKYRLLFESMLNGFIYGKIIYDGDNKPVDLHLLEVNDAFARMAGRKREDFLGASYCEVITGIREHVQDFLDLLDGVVKSGEAVYRERYSPYFERWYFLNAYRPSEDHFAVVFNDITDLKRVREELEKEKIKSEAFLDNTESIIMIIGQDGKVILVNKKGCEVLGYNQSEIIGADLFDLCIDKSKRELVRNGFISLFKGNRSGENGYTQFECTVRTGKGSKRKIKWFNTLLKDSGGNPFAMIVTGNDVSKIDSMEIELKEKDNILSRVMDTSPVGIMIFDEHQRIRFANKRSEKLFGCSKKALIGQSYDDLNLSAIDEEGNPSKAGESPVNSVFNSFKSIYNLLLTTERDNRQSYFLVNAAPATNLRGVHNRIVLVVKDITDYYQAEKMAIKNELKYRTIFENTGTALVIFNGSGILNIVNKEFLKLTGFESDEVVGQKKWTEFIYPADKFRILKQYRKSGNDSEGNPEKYEFRIMNKKAEIKHVVAYLSKIPSSVGQVASILDITTLKQVEDELLRKNKELNDFAYTVSHDLKNPLNLIRGYLELMAEDPQLFSQYYKKIVNQAESLVEFVNKLLELSRAGKIVANMGNINLDYLIRGVFASISARDTEAQIIIHSEPIIIKGDLMNLARLFSNLLSNSFQHKDLKKQNLIIDVRCVRDDKNIYITLKDNGLGIDPEILDKIFIPGFTSGGHLGTGFGLTIAKKITEAHGGSLSVRSEGVGKGAEFMIRLPL